MFSAFSKLANWKFSAIGVCILDSSTYHFFSPTSALFLKKFKKNSDF
jgi:hypothetical protein